jgi:hypothetical protein
MIILLLSSDSLNSMVSEVFPRGLNRIPSRQLTSKFGVSQLSEKTGQEKCSNYRKKTSSGEGSTAGAL